MDNIKPAIERRKEAEKDESHAIDDVICGIEQMIEDQRKSWPGSKSIKIKGELREEVIEAYVSKGYSIKTRLNTKGCIITTISW